MIHDERRQNFRPLPPAPALQVRVDRYVQFMWYELKRHWSMRVIALALIGMVVGMAYWSIEVRLPILQSYQQTAPTLNEVLAQHQRLMLQLAALSTQELNQTLAKLNDKMIDGYTGLSALMEKSEAMAASLGLMLQYSMGELVQGEGVIADISHLNIMLQLMPMPGSDERLVWDKMLRFGRWMVKVDNHFQVLDAHIKGDGKRLVSAEILVQLRLRGLKQSLSNGAG